MNYFQGCQDLKQARKVYISLAQKFHPDKGGDQATMKEINNQFDAFKNGSTKTSRMYYGGARRGGRYNFRDGAFKFGFNWDDLYEDVKKSHFYAKDEWNEDIEREANKREKDRKEKLKAEAAQRKAEDANKRVILEKLLADQIHRIWFEINREIAQNFANGLINKMPDHSLNDFIKEASIMRIIKG